MSYCYGCNDFLCWPFLSCLYSHHCMSLLLCFEVNFYLFIYFLLIPFFWYASLEGVFLNLEYVYFCCFINFFFWQVPGYEDGNFVGPTILCDVTTNMDCYMVLFVTFPVPLNFHDEWTWFINYDSQWKKNWTKDIGVLLTALYLVLSRKRFWDLFFFVCRYCYPLSLSLALIFQ